jgi:methionyl-tRNA formyltransferase
MAGDMRIVIIGQEAFGGKVLESLAEQGENVVGVFVPPDREGRPLDPLKVAAQERDIPVLQFRRMRAQEAIDAFKGLNADLGVMAFVTDIVPDEILEAPTKGTIQYHPSLLPKHRGPSSINWPIIQGEAETGLTIFWPDKGLDTGPVLLQKTVQIGPDDTLGSVYFDNLFPMGVEALAEAVSMVSGGSAPRLVQDESNATYEGWCRAADVGIDWNSPVSKIYNLIRGSDPSPGATTTINGESIQFFRTAIRPGDSGKQPGEVIEVADDGFSVASQGGALFVMRVQAAGSRKVMAPEWMETVGLKAGDRFGT